MVRRAPRRRPGQLVVGGGDGGVERCALAAVGVGVPRCRSAHVGAGPVMRPRPRLLQRIPRMARLSCELVYVTIP